MNHTFSIGIAGEIIRIATDYGEYVEDFRNYLVPSWCSAAHSIHISITKKDIEFEEQEFLSQQINLNKALHWSFDPRLMHFYAIHRKTANLLPLYGAFLMHGSVVSTNNSAYMFTAPSGVGKTTRSLLWLEEFPNSFIINGDKPFIKISDNCVFACGTPWCGKEGWNRNTMVPLKAVYLLERSDEDGKDFIVDTFPSDVLPELLQRCFKPTDPPVMQKTLQLLNQMCENVKLYRFHSSPTRDSIRLAYSKAQA